MFVSSLCVRMTTEIIGSSWRLVACWISSDNHPRFCVLHRDPLRTLHISTTRRRDVRTPALSIQSTSYHLRWPRYTGTETSDLRHLLKPSRRPNLGKPN